MKPLRRRYSCLVFLFSCLYFLTSCAAPMLPSDLDAIKNGKTYMIPGGKVVFTDPEDCREPGNYSARMRPYEYSMTFGKDYAYCLVTINDIREVHAEYPTIDKTWTGETIDEKHAVYTEGIYNVDFSIMTVTVVSVFRNSEYTDIHEYDVLTIGTDYTVGRYGKWEYASHFRKGDFYYLIPNPMLPLPEDAVPYQILMDDLVDYWTSVENCHSYRLTEDGQSVELPRCVWEGKGFDDESKYVLISVPKDEFEEFYTHKIHQYTQY